VEERRDVFGVEPICAAIGVPVSTYYARRSRKPSRRALEDVKLVGEIYAAREGYRCVYGVRKTWKELRRRGVDGRDQVALVMRSHGLEGSSAVARTGNDRGRNGNPSWSATSCTATSPRPARTRSESST